MTVWIVVDLGGVVGVFATAAAAAAFVDQKEQGTRGYFRISEWVVLS